MAKPRTAIRRVLNAGSGAHASSRLQSMFDSARWQEIRFDIDPRSKPDIVGSLAELDRHFPEQSIDAIWSSHVLEHLYAHEVVPALRQFRRILKKDGFALISCPDLESVAALVLERGLDHQAYISRSGPITALDMLFGHSFSIAQGYGFMAHNTGFTCARLGEALMQAGFDKVLAKRAPQYELWALALMEESDDRQITEQLSASGLDMSVEDA